ncbi:hypothetical protein [Rhodococcus gannanensis]|uniref:Uncharacterized protein n=1 Tax=Rhodococcus gannanensis TaxID=1960308 RepID=A0ABW4P1C3_9NOCA
MLSSYDDAARALNASLPGEVLRVEASPGFFTLFSSDWHVIVFCRWWLSYPDARVVDGDSSVESSAAEVIGSMAGRIAATFGYAPDHPEVALLAFADGTVLAMETDSDYEPWSLYTPQGSFTAALSDFR